GGWGFVLAIGDDRLRMSGGVKNTTSNRMELTAAIKALEELQTRQPKTPIVVYSDSQYVVKGITEWIFNWKLKGWRTSTRKPVENADLWQQLDALNEALDVSWKWIRGHSGVPLNEEADSLAYAAIPQ
ncbi:ribonuclease HI, partial [Vibrio parahaemolyticus]|nr:ribonuclease HI [Vibrio parahaemolyticus]